MMNEHEVQRSLERKKSPVYANVLNELKKQSLDEKDFSSSKPLAPMQTGLYPPIQHSTSNDKRMMMKATKQLDKPQTLTPSVIHEKTEQTLKDSTRRLKAIEDHMWQHRQEERDLKRAEADIMRQQKQMEKSIQQYKTKISKYKEEDAQNFQGKESAFVDYQHADLHTRGKSTKDKIQTFSSNNQKFNEDTKKFMKSVNELNVRYKKLMEMLEAKRSEMETLSSSFEARLREKEDEQHGIKKEMASLAIKMNMEAQKKRHFTFDHQREKFRTSVKEMTDSCDKDTKMKQQQAYVHHAGIKHEQNQVKLDQAFTSKQEAIRTKQTQEGRNLADVLTQAKHKAELQQFAQQEADFVRLNMLNEDIQRNVDIANAKRKDKIDTLQQQVRERNSKRLQTWAQRAVTLENETKQQERLERVNRLSKRVAHQDELEHSLYASAKNAESQRKKQMQTLEKLQADLKTLQVQNARKLKEAAAEAQKTEERLHLKIKREVAELSKAVTTREECLRSLAVQRMRAREERRMLEEERKECNRKEKIAKQTNLANATF